MSRTNPYTMRLTGRQAKRKRYQAGSSKDVKPAYAPIYYPRMRGGELKFFDGVKTSTASATGGAIASASLNLIPEGTTQSERIGRKCTVRKIHLDGSMRIPASTANTSADDIVRVMLYQDKQANGATATVANILQSAAWNSFRNMTEVGRFNILKNKVVTINSMGSGGNGTSNFTLPRTVHWKININCNIPLEFNNTTGAITEIRSNNIGVLVISEQGDAVYSYRWRIRYSDY